MQTAKQIDEIFHFSRQKGLLIFNLQILSKSLSQLVASFLKSWRQEDVERNGYNGEYAEQATLWQRIADDIGYEGGADGQTQNGKCRNLDAFDTSAFVPESVDVVAIAAPAH